MRNYIILRGMFAILIMIFMTQTADAQTFKGSEELMIFDRSEGMGGGLSGPPQDAATCGNGFIEPGELCEYIAPGVDTIADWPCNENVQDYEHCREDCTCARCGDHIVDAQFGEQCEVGADPGTWQCPEPPQAGQELEGCGLDCLCEFSELPPPEEPPAQEEPQPEPEPEPEPVVGTPICTQTAIMFSSKAAEDIITRANGMFKQMTGLDSDIFFEEGVGKMIVECYMPNTVAYTAGKQAPSTLLKVADNAVAGAWGLVQLEGTSPTRMVDPATQEMRIAERIIARPVNVFPGASGITSPAHAAKGLTVYPDLGSALGAEVVVDDLSSAYGLDVKITNAADMQINDGALRMVVAMGTNASGTKAAPGGSSPQLFGSTFKGTYTFHWGPSWAGVEGYQGPEVPVDATLDEKRSMEEVLDYVGLLTAEKENLTMNDVAKALSSGKAVSPNISATFMLIQDTVNISGEDIVKGANPQVALLTGIAVNTSYAKGGGGFSCHLAVCPACVSGIAMMLGLLFSGVAGLVVVRKRTK